MNYSEPNGSGEPNVKKRKVNDIAAIAVNQTANILKLDIDCCEEAFDYLPLQDLVPIGKTCKRMQQVAGYRFTQNYSSLAVAVSNKGILGKVSEDIENCVKLKRLEIKECPGESFWHDRKYPTLEDFTYEYSTGRTRKGIFRTANAVGIPMFLEINPNIRNFGTDASFLWEQRDKMMTANIKLDNLTIELSAEDIIEFNDYCNLLDRLHECGFYKKLQVRIYLGLYQEQMNRLASLNGLNKLIFYWGADEESPFSNSTLTSLEELHVQESDLFADINIAANTLINLKQLHFDSASIDDIMPFIRRSVEMHTIHIGYLQAGVYLNENTWIIDVLALNRERSKLPDAQRLTLYVEEGIFLATKWAMKATDFGLIRLKRKQSYGWHKTCLV